MGAGSGDAGLARWMPAGTGQKRRGLCAAGGRRDEKADEKEGEPGCSQHTSDARTCWLGGLLIFAHLTGECDTSGDGGPVMPAGHAHARF
jgi:hypothetical protein